MGKFKEAVEQTRTTEHKDISKELLYTAKQVVDKLPWFEYPPLFINPYEQYIWCRVENVEELSAIQIYTFCADADGMYEDLHTYPAWILVRVTECGHGSILTKDEVIGQLEQYPGELDHEIERAMRKHQEEFPTESSVETQKESSATPEPTLKYSIAPPEKLRQICIDHGWFKGGSNEQYTKLFEANAKGSPVSVIAGIIWLCSDSDDLPVISSVLEKERKAYQENAASERYFALQLLVKEIKTYAVKASDLGLAQQMLTKAYSEGAVKDCLREIPQTRSVG